MRLIDADALKEIISGNSYILRDSINSMNFGMFWDGIEQAIDESPTVDAVPVVRCKDCKHWREGTSFSYCDKLYGMGVLDALDYMTAEDDYCSMAERRTDE